MKKILSIGASNSKNSINRKLAYWAATQLDNVEVQDIDLNDYEMPLYGIDREKSEGIPEPAKEFKQLVNECDGIVLSLAEHNGSYSVAFKNVFDWISRMGKPIWSDKPVLLMATSPGGRGGIRVLETAQTSFPHQGAVVSGNFSLPSFNDNFDQGITNADLLDSFHKQLELFKAAIS